MSFHTSSMLLVVLLEVGLKVECFELEEEDMKETLWRQHLVLLLLLLVSSPVVPLVDDNIES